MPDHLDQLYRSRERPAAARKPAARWLLMCENRAGAELNITHEFLSVMLG
jgi:hypothetical protein